MKSVRRPVHVSTPPESFRKWSIVIFGAALMLRLLHIWQIRQAPFFATLIGDAQAYDAWAQRIAAGDWLGHEVFYQAPLYPYFLGALYAAAGHQLTVVRICQAILGAFACVLLGQAAERLFSRNAGIVAGLALAAYAPAIFFDTLIQKSVLDVLFLCAILSIASAIAIGRDRWRSWFSLGLATAALTLTRENALILVVVILGWILLLARDAAAPWRFDLRRAANHAGAVLLGLAVLLAPVLIRNNWAGGGFYLTTSQFGPNFYIGNNALADGTYRPLRAGRGAPEFERADATELAQQALGRRLTPREVSSYWSDQALQFITGRPVQWLGLMGRKAMLVINSAETIDTEAQEAYADWSPVLRWGGWFGHFGVLVPLAVFGALTKWPERKRLWLFYAMIAAYAASLMVFYVFARYRYPMVPLLMLFAAGGVTSVVRIRSASLRIRLTAVTAVIVAAALANWPLQASSSDVARAVTETNLGIALQGQGRFSEAEEHYRQALASSPDYAPAYNHLGLMRKTQGQPGEAIKAFEAAIAARPLYPDPHYHLAVELQSLGDHQKAVDHFREMLRLSSDEGNVTAATNLMALSLLALGEHRQAEAALRSTLARQPDDAGALGALADVLLRQQRFEEAVKAYRRLVELAPTNERAFHNLGLALLRQDLGQATAAFARAAELGPANPVLHHDLGNALASGGRLDEAIASYERALTLAPSDVGVRNSLAVALAAQGNTQAALAHFRKSLELDPNNPQTRADLNAVLGRLR